MISRYRGCLMGLAVGDALGAPVEFWNVEKIIRRYGEKGISDFQPWGNFPPGSYTDDTQMSLATASGCISAYQGCKDRSTFEPSQVVYRCYLDWLKSQA